MTLLSDRKEVLCYIINMVDVVARNAGSRIVQRLSATELVMLALKKAVNCPFEALIEYGKIKNQLRPPFVRTALHRLKKRELIYCERKGKQLLFALTDEGEKEVDNIKLKLKMTAAKAWDGRWRVLIFDVPEKLRGKRDLLRYKLIGFGFKQLQKSVWVYPYKLPQEFVNLWKETGILKHCVIFETADVNWETDILKKLFT